MGAAANRSRRAATGKVGVRRSPATSPETYTTAAVLTAIRCAERGLTDHQIAGVLGITTVMFDRWKVRYPKFYEALQRGKDVADQMVVDSLFMRATGYTFAAEKVFCTKEGAIVRAETTEHAVPDVQACVFWLKNRQPQMWREKSHVHLTGQVDGAASKVIEEAGDVANLTDEQVARLYADAVNPVTLERVARENAEAPQAAPAPSRTRH